MKIRNKKTGEIITIKSEGELALLELIKNSLPNGLNVWEEVKEPLIKDEKIRKAVRAWAEANSIERVWHEYSSCWLRGNGLVIAMENEVTELGQGNYSIDELCGEEEE